MALARALAVEPAVLLLDEPLSALDASTRGRAARELAATIEAAGVPTLLVTHDYEEAATLADEIGVIDGGRIVQRGTRRGARRGARVGVRRRPRRLRRSGGPRRRSGRRGHAGRARGWRDGLDDGCVRARRRLGERPPVGDPDRAAGLRGRWLGPQPRPRDGSSSVTRAGQPSSPGPRRGAATGRRGHAHRPSRSWGSRRARRSSRSGKLRRPGSSRPIGESYEGTGVAGGLCGGDRRRGA